MTTDEALPVVALTMGDVAGIGPELIARVVADPKLRARCRPLVVGDPVVLERALELIGAECRVEDATGADASAVPSVIHCWNPATVETADVPPGRVHARAGRAAYDWLVAATRAALAGRVQAIVTAPLNKAALHAGGVEYPGHTEILAAECGRRDYAMMLYLPLCPVIRGPYGLAVAHVTLHTSVASVPGLLSTAGVLTKIRLVHDFLQRIGCPSPRIGVCALNPHGGEGGLFGDEEARIIAPAVEQSRRDGVDAHGPDPADTLLQRAVHGAFDGVVAMYHDQGHIALKLIAFQKAVNVTLGLPIIRTSPSHGTGYDISWRGMAEVDGMRAALRVALELEQRRQPAPQP